MNKHDLEYHRLLWEDFVASGAAARVVAFMRECGENIQTVPTFDELVASGRFQAGQVRIAATEFVDPGWFDKT